MSHSIPTNAYSINAPDDTPRIYVACLAAYNSGILHGAWIDATLETEAIMEATQAMLKTSPITETGDYAIHDYEGFENLRLSEWEGFAEVHAYATFIEEHGRLGVELIAYTGNLDHAQAIMSDGYAGSYESLADFAQELTEDTIKIPENLACYIDYEHMARDMEMSGDIFTIETAHDELHIFWSH